MGVGGNGFLLGLSSSPLREPFEKAYKVGHVLGKGGFGIVYAGIRNRDGLQVAIKHIARAKIKDWGQVGTRINEQKTPFSGGLRICRSRRKGCKKSF
jgi:serine/threonine protein kinase